MKTEKIGRATIHNMDCMDFLKGCEDNQFDLAIVDPPYMKDVKNLNNAVNNIRGNDFNLESLSIVPKQDYFDQLKRVSKNQIVWGGNYFTELWDDYCKGFIFWHKHQPVNNFADGEFAWTSFNQNARCFDYKYFGAINTDKYKAHPTQKPVALYEWLLSNYAKEGDSILDTHMGSGSIAIATNKHGFDLTACELDEDCFKAACERIRNAHNQPDMFTPKSTSNEQMELI
jgi:site-specific DNA-methyltransferase (adenine-specific)